MLPHMLHMLRDMILTLVFYILVIQVLLWCLWHFLAVKAR